MDPKRETVPGKAFVGFLSLYSRQKEIRRRRGRVWLGKEIGSEGKWEEIPHVWLPVTKGKGYMSYISFFPRWRSY